MDERRLDRACTPADRAITEQRIAYEWDKAVQRVDALSRDFQAIVESANLAPPDDEHDPEGSTIAFERAQTAALLAHTRTALADLDQAQERLQQGTYGICEQCERHIGCERLESRPATRWCISCAAKTEG